MKERLLIVDDEESILFAMREYFEGLGYAVDCARDKQCADTYLATGEYGMLMVDLRLSAVDCEEGLKIVERVRRSFPATKTIMLTAYGSPEIEAKARKCGADAFVHKPTPLARLAQIAAALLEK